MGPEDVPAVWEGRASHLRAVRGTEQDVTGRWLALQVPGKGELGTELAINNSRRWSHALAGCCRIPLSPESGYIQGSSSNLLAGELLNSSSALFPLYHGCVFLLSFLASDRLCGRAPPDQHSTSRSPLPLACRQEREKPGEMDLSYRSTISIYKSILEQFNPALENLVYLGNNYLRAFHALSKAAEVYFKAIEKIGEQALQSSTSHVLGEILMQMSDTQRLLSSDLEVVAQTFHVDLLQHMEKNSKMDVQFISESQKQYELEYRRKANNLEKCTAELWRMERARDKNVREMKENVMRLRSEMQAFLSNSQREAELEEKRRYRFLADKHQMLYNTLLQFYSRARGMIQTKAPQWKEQLEASRNPSNSHVQGLLTSSHGQGYPSGRLTPTHLETRPLGDFASSMAGSRSSIFSQEPPEMRLSPQPEVPRRPLQRTPSASLVPAGRVSRSGSFGEASSSSEGRRRGGTVRVQAIAPHTTGANRTLLRFDPGDVITVLMPEAQNGWLYGKLEGSSACGWFPEAYVKPLEDARDMEEPPVRSFPLRSSHSMDDILDHPSVSSSSWSAAAQAAVPNPPPAPVGASSHQSGPVTSGGSKKPGVFDQPPELFPRGTNPFATVKLRPTVTNDRSAPIIR
ncbi:brain-specific angiogenesis inhibitor 1-associated protein 2-like protein 2 isoform X2 [Meleagris gallopavo]|uniref:brain-specific angiogenesis inhibitor 1-associated protein 2-like protein 2 isoform X2 n=1 Tax=Meleagris gallopavo TaxID=9103 RepID=UPI00093BC0C2|nr:brain-specific angiogenesis inhibitor 1-associated protein 2-like protein 2 isoform X2 [Meleagris gallopavo]